MQKVEPKILRVGIIQGGKIVEERLLRRRETVTVGQSPKNLFYLPISKLPRSLTLFEVKNDRYWLAFDDQMQGRVFLDEKVFSLQELKGHKTATQRGGTTVLPLDEKSRGKVVLGDVTFLFQYVPMPPVVPRPQLPASAKGGLGNAIMQEYHLLLAILLSLLFQGGVVGIAKVFESPPDQIKKAPRLLNALKVDVEFQKDEEEKPEPTEAEKKEADAKAEAAKAEEKVEEAPPPTVAEKPLPTEHKAPRETKIAEKPRNPGGGGHEDPEALKRRRAAKVRNATILKHITAAGIDGSAGPDALRAGYTASYKSAFDTTGGITVGRPGDVAGFRGGPKIEGPGNGAGGPNGGRVAKLTATERGEAKLKTGEVKVTPVKQEAKINLRIGVTGGTKTGGMGKLDGSEVTGVFKRRASAFKACYESRLKVNPNLSGKVVIQFTIGPAGRITSINVASNSTGDSAVGNCIIGKVKAWRFGQPENGSVTFTYPIVLSKG